MTRRFRGSSTSSRQVGPHTEQLYSATLPKCNVELPIDDLDMTRYNTIVTLHWNSFCLPWSSIIQATDIKKHTRHLHRHTKTTIRTMPNTLGFEIWTSLSNSGILVLQQNRPMNNRILQRLKWRNRLLLSQVEGINFFFEGRSRCWPFKTWDALEDILFA